jgi:hypothetical protein
MHLVSISGRLLTGRRVPEQHSQGNSWVTWVHHQLSMAPRILIVNLGKRDYLRARIQVQIDPTPWDGILLLKSTLDLVSTALEKFSTFRALTRTDAYQG